MSGEAAGVEGQVEEDLEVTGGMSHGLAGALDQRPALGEESGGPDIEERLAKRGAFTPDIVTATMDPGVFAKRGDGRPGWAAADGVEQAALGEGGAKWGGWHGRSRN